MAIITLIIAIIWGALSAQFAAQCVTSFIIAALSLAGIVISKVPKAMNLAGTLSGTVQLIIFGILFVLGNWLTSKYIIDYDTWNASSLAAMLSFMASMIYCIRQVPGKVLLAKMCAFTPGFMEAQMREPRSRRIALARKWRLEGDVQAQLRAQKTGNLS